MKLAIKSPLAPDSKAIFLKKIKSNKVIDQYKKMDVDISYLLEDCEYISVFKCLVTGYAFYHPFNIAGDSFFYEQFQKFEWYYMPWKWEHEIAKSYILDGQSILEVGCAHGAFLERINELFVLKDCVGLELNKTTSVKKSNWKIINQFVQEFQINNKEKFDIVCSFQVLEHISEVHSFLEAKVNCLMQGGKLIISVPNNDSFIKHSNSALNLPPHHMGLWDTKSLEALESIFSLKIIEIHYEELQSYHLDGYIYSQFYSKYNKYAARLKRKIDLVTGKYQKLKKNIENKKHTIQGHTILVVFEKL